MAVLAGLNYHLKEHGTAFGFFRDSASGIERGGSADAILLSRLVQPYFFLT
jgi:hypothetical protein